MLSLSLDTRYTSKLHKFPRFSTMGASIKQVYSDQAEKSAPREIKLVCCLQTVPWDTTSIYIHIHIYTHIRTYMERESTIFAYSEYY